MLVTSSILRKEDGLIERWKDTFNQLSFAKICGACDVGEGEMEISKQYKQPSKESPNWKRMKKCQLVDLSRIPVTILLVLALIGILGLIYC